MGVQNGYNGTKLYLFNGKDTIDTAEFKDVDDFRQSLDDKQCNEKSENATSRISVASKNSTKEDFVLKSPLRNIVDLLDVVQIRVQDETRTVSLSLFNDEYQAIVDRSAYQLCDKYGKSADNWMYPKEITSIVGKKYAFKVAIDDFNSKKLLPVFTVLRLSNDQEIIESMRPSATSHKRVTHYSYPFLNQENEATSGAVPEVTPFVHIHFWIASKIEVTTPTFYIPVKEIFLIMEETPTLSPLRKIQTSKEGEVEHEQPLSPLARIFHESGSNVYNIAIFGMKTLIDVDVFKSELLAHMVEKNRRFTSLQVEKENGSMTWVPSHPDIDNHVAVVPELDPNMESSDKFIEDYISNLSRSQIDYSKPLWDVHILNIKTSYAQGICVFRFHHSLGDGLSLMNLLLACSSKVSDPETLPTLPGNNVSSHHIRVTSFVSLFIVFWNTIVGLVMILLTALFLKDTDTPLKRSLLKNSPRCFAFTTVSLGDIKMVKNAMNVTVNDVIVGVVQSGLYRYLNQRYGGGESNNKVPKNIRFRANIAFNLRPSTQVDASSDKISHGRWGNKASFVQLPFNIRQRKDPLDYVRDVKTVMGRKKASFEPLCVASFIELFVRLFGIKLAAKIFSKIESRATLWFSNVPGPQEEIAFCRHEVAYLAPTSYGIPGALVITAVSYVDKVTFAVSVDEAIVPDPQKLCDDLQESFYLIKTSVSAVEECV
ncbi:O-acyltransferase, WSD1 domain-containing protein [Artemisia annua]|uniref:O-acyltransferase, WSD1 domain-containing protein n=1 Tax=Artemisia annua TaxID=35608 RepID=A0A2U1PQ99_ARTAN|nr:O-acyltransferase, WSD1 domain-containing protein [Artemisia annua]